MTGKEINWRVTRTLARRWFRKTVTYRWVVFEIVPGVAVERTMGRVLSEGWCKTRNQAIDVASNQTRNELTKQRARVLDTESIDGPGYVV